MNGIINIYKEKGYTSHDVVAVVRRTLKQKTGHTGTLDPMAEGVLPVCIGKATRLADYIMGGVKEYRGHIILGVVTDTQDNQGCVLAQKPVTATRAEIEACILSFAGVYDQSPPMYSAVKVNGRRLYELARAGVTVERTPRRVEIYEIGVKEFISDTEAVIDVRCGKGTYIRTLCADIGEKLGCGAHMGGLLRMRSGNFTLTDAVKLDRLKELAESGRLEECVRPIPSVLSEFRSVRAIKSAEKYLYNGNKLRRDQVDGEMSDGEKLLIYDSGDKLIGVYIYTAHDNMLKCEIMLI